MQIHDWIWTATTWQVERYLLISVPIFLVTVVLVHFALFRGKRQQRPWKAKILRHELISSLVTSIVFGWAIIANALVGQAGYSTLYTEIDKYGYAFFLLSFPVGLMIHDAYFYWCHRWLHTVKFLRRFHAAHHKSRNPSALASLSFSPVEAAIHASFSVFYLTLIPVHPYPFMFITTMYLVSSTLGHTGIELYPKWFARHFITKHLATPTHHDLHHQFGGYNYALYFTWWDRLLKTEHPDYLRHVDDGVSRKPSTNEKLLPSIEHSSILTALFKRLDRTTR